LHDPYDDFSDGDLCSMDSSVVDLQVNLHEQQDMLFSKAPCLLGQQWKHLNPDTHETWDLLSDDAKAIIFGAHKVPSKYIANWHEISVFDFIQANLHDLQMGGVNDSDNPSPSSDDSMKKMSLSLMMEVAQSCSLFWQNSSQSCHHPGYLANVLSKFSQGAKLLNKQPLTISTKGK